ncbi:hypothetical protein BJX65DRAFT_99139 [Aspergillus insuetus]
MQHSDPERLCDQKTCRWPAGASCASSFAETAFFFLLSDTVVTIKGSSGEDRPRSQAWRGRERADPSGHWRVMLVSVGEQKRDSAVAALSCRDLPGAYLLVGSVQWYIASFFGIRRARTATSPMINRRSARTLMERTGRQVDWAEEAIHGPVGMVPDRRGSLFWTALQSPPLPRLSGSLLVLSSPELPLSLFLHAGPHSQLFLSGKCASMLLLPKTPDPAVLLIPVCGQHGRLAPDAED